MWVNAVGRGIERRLREDVGSQASEDAVRRCERRQAAIIQPSRTLSGCLLLPRDATTPEYFSNSSVLTFRRVNNDFVSYNFLRGKGV